MKLDITMFSNAGIFHIEEYKYDHIKCGNRISYKGKRQMLNIFHNSEEWYKPSNNFHIIGHNNYDRMKVDTTEKLKAVALLMGYDEEIINVIEKLGQNEADTRL